MNWSGGTVPGAEDDVVIDVAAEDVIVTLASGNHRIKSLIANERLTLTGDSVDAAWAAAHHLVNLVVPPERVLDEAIALAERIAANGPLAVSATKRLVRAAAFQPADDVWRLQDELVRSVFESEDAREGALAFIEKRAPVWKGR